MTLELNDLNSPQQLKVSLMSTSLSKHQTLSVIMWSRKNDVVTSAMMSAVCWSTCKICDWTMFLTFVVFSFDFCIISKNHLCILQEFPFKMEKLTRTKYNITCH